MEPEKTTIESPCPKIREEHERESDPLERIDYITMLEELFYM